MDTSNIVTQGLISFAREFLVCRYIGCDDGRAMDADYIPETGRIALFTCTTNSNHKWYVCIECNDPTKRWTTLQSARTHERKSPHDNTEFRKPSDYESTSSMSAPMDNNNNNRITGCINLVEFGRPESKEFYLHEVNGKGRASLVARSMTSRPLGAQDNLDKDRIDFHMQIARLSNNLTSSQMMQFAGILRFVQKRYLDIADEEAKAAEPIAKRQRKASPSQNRWSDFASFIREDLPTSKADIRRRYLEGTNSILQNLPHPKVELLDGKVGYASVIDCLRDFMANGNVIQALSADSFDGAKVTRLEECKVAAKVFKTCSDQEETSISEEIVTCTSFLLEWFDDCEPNSNIKNNRGGVTLKSITFGQPKTKSNDLRYTYLIAVGPKNETETIADKRFIEELKLLRKGVVTYSHKEQQNVLVRMDLLAVLADQIARRGATGISLGNGTFAARWGYAADAQSLEKQLPSCSHCANVLFETHKINTNCTSCLNWDFEDAPNPKLLETPAPQGFPKDTANSDEIQDGGDGAAPLRPVKLSFELLQESIKNAHDNVVLAKWTQAEARVYLRSWSLDTDTIDQVIQNASNVRKYEVARSHKDDGPEARDVYGAIKNLRAKHPEHFEVYKGLTRTVLDTVQEFLARKNKLKSFLRRVDGRLESIDKLGLHWAKLQGYRKGTFGGWISENYLHFTRFMGWFFSDMSDLLSEPPFVEPVNKQQKDWLKVENEGWLQCRGLSTTGKADELRKRVREYMDQEGGPPPKLEDADIGDFEMLTLVDRFRDVVETALSREVTEEVVERLDVRIKLFLNCLSLIDKRLNRKGKKPVWIRSYNFMSLLNLPAAMRLYGPLVNLWEGKLMGEAIVSHCKSELENGLRGNWAVNVLLKHYRKRALHRLTEETPKDDNPQHTNDDTNEDDLMHKGKGRRAFKRYDDYFQIMSDFSQGVPLSAVCWRDAGDPLFKYSFGIAFGQPGKDLYFRQLVENTEQVTTKNGLKYCAWELTDISCQVVSLSRVLPVVLLPLLEENKKNFYTVNSSEWKPLRWIF